MIKTESGEKTYNLRLEIDEWDDENIAFIKNDVYDGRDMWIVCASDGTKLAATDNRDFAFIVARQNDLEPKSVH